MTSAPSATANNDLPPSSSAIDTILSSSPQNHFQTMSLPLSTHPPSVVRKAFLNTSRSVHPDKNSDVRAKEAFQRLSASFQVLHDAESQRVHLGEMLLQRQREEEEGERCETKRHHTNKKKRGARDDWKRTRAKKKQKAEEAATAPPPPQKKWEDVVAEIKRWDEMEREHLRRKSDERLERRIRGTMWRAMRVCRELDLRAGCPSHFVNGLWAPLYEQEVCRSGEGRALPEGWEFVCDRGVRLVGEPPRRRWRNVVTGEETVDCPNREVRALLERAAEAESTNECRWATEPRQFLDEIVQYLKDDHEYRGMDEEMADLVEMEKERDGKGGDRDVGELDY